MAVKHLRVATSIAMLASTAQAAVADQPELAYLAVSEGYWEVWVSDADGSDARQVTKSKNDKTRVSWYPEGDALLATCNEGSVVRVELSGLETKIPLEQYPVVDAVLSPDGKSLAYSFSTAIDGNDIWIAAADGSGAEKIVRMTTLQHEPVWTLDSSHVYFLSGGGGQAHDIWRVSLQSRSTEQLTVGSLYHFDIAVAANGDMAFSSNRSGNYEVYLQSPGGEPRALTDHPALDGRPTFSSDGSEIIFESTRSGSPNLWRLNLSTKSIHQITHHVEGARAPAWYHGRRK